jgi:hypothetical protein|nr:hypothetical protein [Ruminococcus bromii]
MQRKFLEDLGLEKSVVDKILNENGADIEKAKSRLETEAERRSLFPPLTIMHALQPCSLRHTMTMN